MTFAPNQASTATLTPPAPAGGTTLQSANRHPAVRHADEPRAKEEKTRSPSGFLFSPAIDLLFIANLCWPLLLVVDIVGGVTTHESLLFWQIYFITAPHRWITLVLVTFDHDKTANRRRTFASLAIGILLACVCLRFGTGSLLCLGVIDYIWNAWHFSSQHHGIFRIYERKRQAGGGRGEKTAGSNSVKRGEDRSTYWPLAAFRGRDYSLIEKTIFRAFLLYVIARVAGWGWPEGPFAGSEPFSRLDLPLLAIPLFFVGRQLLRWSQGAASFASVAYLTSMMGLFTSMLVAAHLQKGQLVIQLALASAVFHSVEYLSIVTWSMQRKRDKAGSQAKTMAYLSRMWLLFLAVFVVVIGAGNYLLSRGFFDLWVLTNLVVAFWHYCFDGMIWKSPNRAPSAPVSAQGAA